MRTIFLTALIFILALQSHAQYKPMLFGLKAGVNAGWMKSGSDNSESAGVEPGFTWGFIGEFFIMENYAIMTGFNVNFNGGNLEYPALMDLGNDTVPVTGMLHRQYHLKYLQIPLCLKMQTDVSERWRIFGKIGLGTAFALDAKGTDRFEHEGGTEDIPKHDINEEIVLMRQSLIVGGGAEFILKNSTALIFDITFDNGFNNILKINNPEIYDTKPRGFHNFLEFSAGIVF